MAEHINKAIQKMELELSQVTRTKSVLNQNQIQKLWNSTPRKYKYSRPGKGGSNWTYAKVSYVRKVLDSVFGFDWDFDVETTLGEAFDVAIKTKACVVKGTLTARVVDDSGRIREIKKTQFGRAEVKFRKDTNEPMDFGNDMKAATSDCLKKCASLFGIAADIYEADEFIEITISGSDTEKAKEVDKKIEKAKQELNTGSEEVK